MASPPPTPFRSPADPTAAVAPLAPTEPHRELTLRAVLVAVLVAALMGASDSTVVLRIGYGPNISVVSAFFGFILIGIIGLVTGKRATRWENNLVQTAGTAAGQASFMVVWLAAVDMLEQKGLLHLTLSRVQVFLWLSLAGMLGVLLAVPLRRHYIDEEDLRFADGTAAGETLLVLDQGAREAGPRVAALGIGTLVSGLIALLRDGEAALSALKLRFLQLPGELSFRFLVPFADKVRFGTEVGVLSLGAGLLIGLRIGLSMLLGSVLAWVIAPGPLVSSGIVAELSFTKLLQTWIMWPATGLMVAGGVTALALKWRSIARSFRGLGRSGGAAGDFPMRLVVPGVLVLAVALAVLQYVSLGFPLWLTVVSLLLSVLLMMVGIRVLGETNWAPISAMANVMQAVFAVLAPGHVPINMVGSGMSGSIAANGEHLMQDFRAGKIVGSTNRNLTILQLVGVPSGAFAVAVCYPLVKARYGIGGEHGLTSPISQKWAGFAELLSRGVGALPPSALWALGLAVVLGVVLTLLEATRLGRFLPSPTALGMGMLIPGYAVVPMALGGAVQHLWSKLSPRTEGRYCTPLASGFIIGEALVILALAFVAVIG